MPDGDSNSTDDQRDPPAAEVREAENELKQAIQGSKEVLGSATTVFPFTFFPDTVTVDRTKVTVTHRSFLRVAEIVSIRIEDILNVAASVGPLFGSLHITARIFSPDKPYEINFLWREDALRLKRIMQGYVIAMQKKIDVSPLDTKELTDMLDELGKDDHIK